MKQIVLASGNPGKIREIRSLLAPLAIEVIPQTELGISEAEEPYDTFLENALAKARHASRAARLPALSVDALGGAPGVHSAYYAGRQGNREERDARNNAKLLASLKDNRKAHYTCVIVLLESINKPANRGRDLARGDRARAARLEWLRLRPFVRREGLGQDRGRTRRGRKKPHQPSGEG